MIRCREIYNCPCLRCSFVKPIMVRVGAMIFCNNCWDTIFGGQENFELDSHCGRQYLKWVNIYKGKGE